MHIELTAFSKGPVIRAEAAADHQMGALDLALDKMAAQMRRAADRRRVHRGRHAPKSVGQALAEMPVNGSDATSADDLTTTTERQVGPIAVTGDGPLVVREKTHPASPMTLDQALYEMELVGHDFYLFVDKESERPAVVYRRRGYDYGVISLDLGDGDDRPDERPGWPGRATSVTWITRACPDRPGGAMMAPRAPPSPSACSWSTIRSCSAAA